MMITELSGYGGPTGVAHTTHSAKRCPRRTARDDTNMTKVPDRWMG